MAISANPAKLWGRRSGRRGQGKRKGKSGALIHRSLGPHFAPMAMHQPLDDGQANAPALKFLLAVQTLENPKQSTGILGLKPYPVIAHKIDQPLRLDASSQLL